MKKPRVKGSRYDGYVNMLNKVGTSKDPLENYTYAYENPTPDVDLAQIYATNGLFGNIINKPSELALKNGYDLKIADADIEKSVKEKLAKLKWDSKAVEAMKWSRLFGGAAILLGVDDGGDWDEPVNRDNVINITSLVVLERPEITPDYTSVFMRDLEYDSMEHFGLPEYYNISPVYGGSQVRVHESRLLIFRNGIMPRTGSASNDYTFFGPPEYNRIRRELRDTITTHGNGYRLLERCVQAVYKMKNLSALLSTEDGEDDVIKRMQLIDMARSLLNTMVIDADGEDWAFQTFQLSGVKDIVDESCNLLSAVTNIPQTVLFGRSPAGENATGEGDLTNYYDYVGQLQGLNITDNLRYLVDLILAVERNCGRIDSIPDFDPVPNPLWSMSEKEKAELDSAKAQAALTKAQATQTYVDMQVLDPQEVRRSLAESDEYQIDEVLSEDDLGLDDMAANLPTGVEQQLPDEPQNQEVSPEESQEETTDAVEENERQGAAVIVIDGGKILCGRRKDDGTICGPGGHVEDGEQPEQAAVREAQEEFGITPHNLYHMGVYKGSLPLYLPSNVYLTTSYTGDVAADDEEMTEAQWLPLSDLRKEKLFPPFAAGIDLLMKVISGDTGHG